MMMNVMVRMMSRQGVKGKSERVKKCNKARREGKYGKRDQAT